MPHTSPLTPDDRAHLKTLSICWYVYAGLTLIGALCGMIYFIAGIVIAIVGGVENEEEAIVMGSIFGVTGLIIVLVVIPIAILGYLTGKGLAQQRRRTLIYVMAGLACTNIPLGLVLGVFTFIVMGRPTVKAAFDQQRQGVTVVTP